MTRAFLAETLAAALLGKAALNAGKRRKARRKRTPTTSGQMLAAGQNKSTYRTIFMSTDERQGSQLVRSAMRYAEVFGWPVLPLWPREKNPLTPHGYKDATRDEKQIQEWWQKWPNANIGVPTGVEFWVLDVDPRHGGDVTLEGLILKHGPLPKTRHQRTGGGGSQFMFALPDQIEIACHTAILPGIDIKGRGGYVVVPPSIHPCGKEYIWDCAEPPGEQLILPASAWLLDLVVPPKNNNDHAGKIQAPDRIPKGNQHMTLFKLGCSMRGNGFGETEIFAALWAANQNRCEEPGPEENIRELAASICKQYEPGSTQKKPPRAAVIDLAQAEPSLELLNALDIFGGRIQFRFVRRRGPMIIATPARGQEIIWYSIADLTSFSRSQAILAEATHVLIPTPPKAKIRTAWEPAVQLLLELADRDKELADPPLQDEFREMLRSVWERAGSPSLHKNQEQADELFVDLLRQSTAHARDPHAEPPACCVWLAEGFSWVHLPSLLDWLSCPVAKSKHLDWSDARKRASVARLQL